MISFKEFINEEVVTPDKLKELLDGDFSEWSKKPLYRGDNATSSFIGDARTKRDSANTTFHYNTILSNHPDFKKQGIDRNACLITSSSKSNAATYGKVSAIIPVNGSTVAMCKFLDMWETPVNVFGSTDEIVSWNRVWTACPSLKKQFSSWKSLSFEEAAHALANPAHGQEDYPQTRPKNPSKETIEKYVSKFRANVLKSYSAKSLGITFVADPASIQKNREVWFSTKYLSIPIEVYEKL